MDFQLNDIKNCNKYSLKTIFITILYLISFIILKSTND